MDGLGWDALGGLIVPPGSRIRRDVKGMTAIAGPVADWRSQGGIRDEKIADALLERGSLTMAEVQAIADLRAMP